MKNKDHPNNGKLLEGNCISRIFFHYMYKVIKKGGKKIYQYTDLYELEENQKFDKVYNDFIKYLTKQSKKGWNFQKCFIRFILPTWYLKLIGNLIANILALSYPFLLRAIINWFTADDPSDKSGYWLVCIIFVVSLSRSIFIVQGMAAGRRCMILIYHIIYGMYFNKIERISLKCSNYLNITKVTNSLTKDVLRIVLTMLTSHQLIISPLLMIIYIILLSLEIGWVSLIGLAVLFVITLSQFLLSRFISKISKNKFLKADERNKQIKNSIFGIKSIKFNAWEPVIQRIVDQLRKKELSSSYKLLAIRSIVDGIIFVMPMICALICIVVYQELYSPLSLGSIFYVIFTFNLFGNPMRVFFFSIMNLFEAKVSFQRLKQTMSYPDETEEDDLRRNDEDMELGVCEIKDGKFSFISEELVEMTNRFLGIKNNVKTDCKPVLEDINLKISKGEFVAVIGEVGAGKSALLKAFSKSLFKERGEVRKNGKLAYIPQEAFLANATFKNNIILGGEVNNEKYEEVIKNCELLPDIRILTGGDQTEIGERGINLSGGQKQRISIARAIYADADIYLIDDSLSALDAHVGQNIFKNVFKGMIADKTKIMVTHALQYLNEVDRIVFIDKGRIVGEGSFTELKQRNELFQEFVKEQEKKQESMLSRSIIRPKQPNTTELMKNNKNMINGKRKESIAENDEDKAKEAFPDKEKDKLKTNATIERTAGKGRLIKKESRFTGQVNFKVYMKYFSAAGWPFFLFNMFLIILGPRARAAGSTRPCAPCPA